MAEDAFCAGCGKALAACADGCAARLRYDPPRWCTACGTRLDVQVYPDRVVTACRRCRRPPRHAR